MGLIETLLLFGLGFVAFFATGIDDTIAYAGSYLNNRGKDHKKLISLGIILGTLIALGIAILAGSLMAKIPFRHLIGGAVLITLGLLSFSHGKELRKHKESYFFNLKKYLKIKPPKFPGHQRLKFIGIGMILFFGTGIDDILAYSNLIMAKGAWLAICMGVLIATFVSLVIAHFLSDKLKRFPHPERIGGIIIITIGLLIALKIL
jgi:predicted tellurium resistance membrane protein TerC